MPFLAIIAVVGMAVSAYTVVTGLQEGNNGKALMGVLGLVTGGMGAAAAAAPVVAAAPATSALTSGVSGMAAAPAMSAAASPVSTIASGAPALTNMAAAPSALTGAAANASAVPATLPAVGASGAGAGMQSVKGPVSNMNMGTDLKSAFDSGMNFMKENPELMKVGGSLVQGAMNQSTAQDNLRAQREYNDQLRADDEAQRKRRSYVPAPTVYHRRDR